MPGTIKHGILQNAHFHAFRQHAAVGDSGERRGEATRAMWAELELTMTTPV